MMFQVMGTNRSQPELNPRTRLGKFAIDKLVMPYGNGNLRDLFVVEGRIYRVYVKTIKRAKGEDVDRTEEHWYSVVKVIDGIVEACSEADVAAEDEIPF
jgi:hypothetical protein